MGSVADVRASDALLTDANGDGIITADEVANYSALLTYGLSSGYHLLMSDMSGAIADSDAYAAYLETMGADPTNVVVGTISESDGKLYFKAAEALNNLVYDLFSELSSDSLAYTAYPAVTTTATGLLSLWQKETGYRATENAISGVQYIEYGSPVSTYDNTYSYIQFFSPGIASEKYGGNYYNYSVDQMYYYKYADYVHAVVYDSDAGQFIECTVGTKNRIFSLNTKAYLTNGYTTWSDSDGIGNFACGARGIFRGLYGRSCLLFNSLLDIYDYYNFESSAYVASDSPQSISQLLLDTLNNTDWTNLSNTLWDTVSGEIEESQALGAMGQTEFQQIIDDNFTKLDESIGAANEGSISSDDLEEILNQIAEDGERQTSWLIKIHTLLEAIHGILLEGGSGATGSMDTTALETIVSSQLQQNAQYQQENSEREEAQHEENKTFFASVTEFFGSFFDNLIDSIVGIFIPDDETMSDLFDQLEQFFEEKFGFLYYPFDLLTDVFDIFTSAESKTVLTFPGFEIMGETVWNDIEYDLSAEPLVADVLGYVRTGTGVLLGFWFINYLRVFFDKRFGGGGN